MDRGSGSNRTEDPVDMDRGSGSNRTEDPNSHLYIKDLKRSKTPLPPKGESAAASEPAQDPSEGDAKPSAQESENLRAQLQAAEEKRKRAEEETAALKAAMEAQVQAQAAHDRQAEERLRAELDKAGFLSPEQLAERERSTLLPAPRSAPTQEPLLPSMPPAPSPAEKRASAKKVLEEQVLKVYSHWAGLRASMGARYKVKPQGERYKLRLRLISARLKGGASVEELLRVASAAHRQGEEDHSKRRFSDPMTWSLNARNLEQGISRADEYERRDEERAEGRRRHDAANPPRRVRGPSSPPQQVVDPERMPSGLRYTALGIRQLLTQPPVSHHPGLRIGHPNSPAMMDLFQRLHTYLASKIDAQLKLLLASPASSIFDLEKAIKGRAQLSPAARANRSAGVPTPSKQLASVEIRLEILQAELQMRRPSKPREMMLSAVAHFLALERSGQNKEGFMDELEKAWEAALDTAITPDIEMLVEDLLAEERKRCSARSYEKTRAYWIRREVQKGLGLPESGQGSDWKIKGQAETRLSQLKDALRFKAQADPLQAEPPEGGPEDSVSGGV